VDLASVANGFGFLNLNLKLNFLSFYVGLGQIEFGLVTLSFFFNLLRVGFQRAAHEDAQRRRTGRSTRL